MSPILEDSTAVCRQPEELAEGYRTHFPRIFGFIVGRLRDHELSQELTADVFASAYERWGQLRDQSAVTWWLFAIARNHIAGHFRSRERELRARARLELLAGDGFADDCPADEVERSHDVERLKTFICRLSERDQELISLRFDAALTSAEIGKVLGISQQNVRVRIFRALRRLRELMTSQAAAADAAPASAHG